MFELGTHKTKLWRSSKNEWFGGTEGFYYSAQKAELEGLLDDVVGATRTDTYVFRPCIVAGPGDEGLLQVLGIGEAESRGLRKGVVINIDQTVRSIADAVTR